MTVVVWTQEIERCCGGGCCIRAAVAQRQCYFNLTEKRKHVARRCGSVFSLSEGRVGILESGCNLLQSIRLGSRDSNPIVVRPLEINQFRGRCVNSVRRGVSLHCL
ncbi:hypothetical protein ALC62_09320 [Cyphomyrmex costatus]|uniref:Uncharacterized protein n=1 Tax=Cyphomyrmex costatus TaxID=456900 RepID=A0A195CG52_9HYME|nr:hypothetical protein ALC62_09320 [Cyphomyrmex costatus]